jgi:N-acetylneuraminic acid mutarotase
MRADQVRVAFESLESRRLLAVSVNVNFQPDGVSVPTGFRVDTGAAYGLRANGLTYGWNADNRVNARDRNAHPDQRYDTLNHMQRGGSFRWEIAIPNGTYAVRVVAGDPSYFDGYFHIMAENMAAIDAAPSSGQRFLEGSVSVEVKDGRLTLSNGSRAVNNKLNFVEIRTLVPTQPDPVWRVGASLPVALGEVAGGFVNGRLYVVGDGSSSTLRFDPNSNSWSSSLAKRPYPAKDQLAEVFDGKLYVFGGVIYKNGQQALDRVQIYNPSTNTWTQGARMPFPSFAAQTALIDGQIYLAGGVTSGNVTTNRLARYNPATNQWTELAPMLVGRNSAPAGTDGRRLFVFGGRDGGDRPHPGLTNVQVYDPATNRWSNVNTIVPRPTGGIVKAPFYNGEFYIIGGETDSAVVARVDIYNPATNTWRRGPDMITPRHGIYPVLQNARIYVAGGGVVVGKSESRILEFLQL